MTPELARFERYKAWCGLLNIKPAAFDTWRKESRRIPELNLNLGL